MNYSILGTSKDNFCQQLKKRNIIAILVTAFAVIVNVALTLLREEATHKLMLCLNILVDLVAGSFVLYFVTARILPAKNLLRLFSMPRTTIRGEVVAVDRESCRYANTDCYKVTVGKSQQRIFFLHADNVPTLEVGQTFTMQIANNVIMEIHQ